METRTPLGQNRTGVQMSPIDSKRMLCGARDIAEAIAPAGSHAGMPGSDARGRYADAQVRERYASEAEGLGSVPLPLTWTGAAKAGAELLTGRHPQVLLDKLGERLAFERSGVRLYDTLLVKARAMDCGLGDGEVAQLQRFREQEAQHFELLAQAIQDLGGDPTAQTPGADLIGVEALGLVQAVNDPRTSFAQSLHVVLDAELIDNAGWELLMRLARHAGHAPVAERFEIALQQEAVHLRTLLEWLGRLTLADAGVDGQGA